MGTDYVKKNGVPFVFIERAMDKEVDIIFHCTTDITGAVAFGLEFLPRSIAKVWELVIVL